MQRTIKFLLVTISVCILACNPKNDLKAPHVISGVLPNAPKETEAILEKVFPGALAGPEFSDSLFQYVSRKYNVTADKMLLGASMCVDDIIYTKNFHSNAKVKGPFNLGGLGGLPFTGTSGLDAFAHHIPEGGTMLLLILPHIGFSESKGWGYVLRHEQHEASSCCGALMGTLNKLEKGSLLPGIKKEDYQGGIIGQLALDHQKEILSAESPIIELTKVTSNEAERWIRGHVLDVNMDHMKYVIIITGILINTDYSYSDYVSVNHFIVYDVSKKAIVEDVKDPLRIP